MDKLLEQLLAAEVLTEETKSELQAAFKQQLEEAKTIARADVTASVTAELNEQWITERETLIEALDSKVTEALVSEIEELREDIERFRDLEAEYATKIVEAKQDMTETLKSDIAQLISELDTWLEIRLTGELDELREDVKKVQQDEFGRTIFNAFVTEFKKHYTADNSTEAQLSESQARLTDAMAALEQAEMKAARLERSIKLEKILSPLSGRTKEVMEAILKSVETPLLEDAYKTYIGRVLKETTAKEVSASEKETPVLAEGKTSKTISGVVKTGDNQDQMVAEATIVKQETSRSNMSQRDKDALRRAAGI